MSSISLTPSACSSSSLPLVPAPGLKFSIPNVANINKEYLFRKEAQVSDATARLNARASKKSDKFCK